MIYKRQSIVKVEQNPSEAAAFYNTLQLFHLETDRH